MLLLGQTTLRYSWGNGVWTVESVIKELLPKNGTNANSTCDGLAFALSKTDWTAVANVQRRYTGGTPLSFPYVRSCSVMSVNLVFFKAMSALSVGDYATCCFFKSGVALQCLLWRGANT